MVVPFLSLKFGRFKSQTCPILAFLVACKSCCLLGVFKRSEINIKEKLELKDYLALGSIFTIQSTVS